MASIFVPMSVGMLGAALPLTGRCAAMSVLRTPPARADAAALEAAMLQGTAALLKDETLSGQAAAGAASGGLSEQEASRLEQTLVGIDAARVPLLKMCDSLPPAGLAGGMPQALLGLYVIHCEGAPLPQSLAADVDRAAALGSAGGLADRFLAKAAVGIGRSVLGLSLASPFPGMGKEAAARDVAGAAEIASLVRLETELDETEAIARGLAFQRMVIGSSGRPEYVYKKTQVSEE
eukprot:CAMPEP_0183356138 /NCGR_PEP_ID=MMETSP0164_2-20130417/43281_1 /TAXON_ID=221442 /ORGANISM="Coccolithus pelagicus ssp braarudi, Strain PLY182g" /LENGTH=234 /DNA_ID=CAMNT_0025529457 /DNA_START=8 /DNA_END=712 /DNA_ORIENTATION=-